METRKLTEGGILSAIQIILGIILIPTGIGYSFYVEIFLPISVTLVVMRCGKKVGLLSGFNTIAVIMLCFSNGFLALYSIQALGFGVLTGWILEKKWSVLSDLLVECLLGCVFLLVLDWMTAGLLGTSLLSDEVTDMLVAAVPTVDETTILCVYYLSIAAIPIASVLITYIGSLFIGNRLGILQKTTKEKYRILRYYKRTAPYLYLNNKGVEVMIGYVGIQGFLWQYLHHAYFKTWVACSCTIILYFCVLDAMKLIGQAIYLKSRRALYVLVYHLSVLMGLMQSFWWTMGLLIGVGWMIDYKMQIKKQQGKLLAVSLNQLRKI